MHTSRTVFLTALALVLAGCLTPADRYLTQNLLPKEKADILVGKAVDAYDKMVEADSLKDIPQIKAVLKTALDTDPQNLRAAEYLKKVDSFLTRREGEVQAKAKTLTAKASLTDKEKYTLVVLVLQLQTLAPADLDLTKLLAQVAPLRSEVVQRSIMTLQGAEVSLNQAKTPQTVGKALSAVHNAIEALKAVDPSSAPAAAAAQRLSAFLAAQNKADLASARKAFASKDYAAAARALARVESMLSVVGKDSTDEVNALQYQVYFQWATDLFAAKKFSEAETRIAAALGVKLTPEARSLRDKIAAAANTRDYDAEYDALDRQLDALVKAGDLKTAWSMVTVTTPLLKKDDPKARIAARRKQILDAAHALYDSAVASYNDEDYREALSGFDTVVAVDPAWQLVKAYQDKARAKLQALGGN